MRALFDDNGRIYLKLGNHRLHVLTRILIAIAILVGVFSPPKHCYAQAEFRHYSSDDGFTGSGFKIITQDSLGFLWIASNSLMFKFDGFTFTPYRISDLSSANALTTNPSWIDTKGNLWVMGPNSLSFYDRDRNYFQKFVMSIGGETAHAAHPDPDGVWLGAFGKGLIRYEFTTQTQTDYLNKTRGISVPQSNTIRTIKDDGEYLLLGTDQGLWKFDKKNKEFIRPYCSVADSALMYSARVKKIFTVGNEIWLWIDQQLVKVDSKFSAVQRLDFKTILEKFDFDKKFASANVPKVAFDPEGFFWIATQGLGLIRYEPSTDQLVNYRNNPTVEQSLPSDVLHDVMVDRHGNVWVTTVNKGIAKLKKQSLHFYNYMRGISTTGIEFLKGNNSNYVVTGTTGNGLWVAPIDGTLPDRLKFEKVKLEPFVKGFENAIEVFMGKDRFWIGSLNSGVLGVTFNKQTGNLDLSQPRIFKTDPENVNTISENFVTALIEDLRGHLWIGTGGTGTNEVDLSAEYGAPGSVNRYRFNISEDTISDDHSADVKIEPDQSTVVSTNSGIYFFRPKSEGYAGEMKHIMRGVGVNKTFRASDGTLFAGAKTGLFEVIKSDGSDTVKAVQLPGKPFITSILEDQLGRIWCSSFEGLFCYDRRSQFVSVFRKEDGMPSSRTVNAAGSVRTPDGLMIFSNSEGITVFDPLSLKLSKVKPRPILTQLRINNKDISPVETEDDDRFVLSQNINTLKELTLNHNHIILTIEFSAMDFTFPEKNNYRYMLKGFDREWVHADWKERRATYTNLNPGTYTFAVMASNVDGIWNNDETTLTITVLPPPWKTWWAYSAYGIILASLLFIARRNIIKQERLASKLALEHIELEKVQEIDRTKTNFFANISHEFRTPLTLIQGPVQNLMEKFKTDPDVNGQLNLVQQNSDRLLRLVNQILELARLESGTLKNDLSESDIIHFLKQIIGSFAAFAVQKKISFIQQLPDLGVRAQFDKDKLEKITSNLISNALKFTPEQGAVIVNVSVNTNNGSGELQLRVTDTGKGIPEDKMSKVFERFYQVSEDGNINVGSGIGLALCKELAEFLGGSLKLESKVGEGCRFTLLLPLEKTELVEETKIEEAIPVIPVKAEVPLNGKAHPEEQLEKPMVLVVEDHADLRKFIIACLGPDYNFIEASNGRDGLEHAIEQIPTIILSDVMMPEMDGIEMCSKIKLDHRTSHIPVILLTAKASNESKLSGLGIGADDYIIKPFNKDELKLKIRNQVVARTRMQERIRLEFLSESTTIKAISADEKFLEKLKKIIETRLSDELLSVESLTEEIGMSRAQLYRKVTALTGLSGNEFIRKLRLQRAAQLLQQQVGSVSQVAYDVGFSNLSYFSKCFKEQFGVLPSEYSTAKSISR